MGLNVIYMPLCEDYRFLVIAHCDLSGWVEGKLLCTLFSQLNRDFLLENIICKYGCFRKLIINRKLENKDAVTEFARRYGVKRVVVSAYHP